MELNITLFRMINDLGKEYTYLNTPFICITEYMLYGIAIAALFFWFTRINKNRIMVICAFLTVILAEILGKVAGMFHTNYQPFAVLTDVNKLIEKDINNSFPSDHTIIMFSFCFVFWLFSKSKYRFLWIIVALLAGISRIWVGVHYPADVAVGALISIISALIIHMAVQKSTILLRIFSKKSHLTEQQK